MSSPGGLWKSTVHISANFSVRNPDYHGHLDGSWRPGSAPAHKWAVSSISRLPSVSSVVLSFPVAIDLYAMSKINRHDHRILIAALLEDSIKTQSSQGYDYRPYISGLGNGRTISIPAITIFRFLRFQCNVPPDTRRNYLYSVPDLEISEYGRVRNGSAKLFRRISKN